MTRTFVQLADSLVTDFDTVEFLQTVVERSLELLAADDGGVMIADQTGQLQVMTLSSEAPSLKKLFKLQTVDGPCLDSYHTGQPILNVSPDGMVANWPQFGPIAAASGYRFLHAFPLQHRGRVVGAMNLLCSDKSPFSPDGIALAQGLADIATLGLLQQQCDCDPPVLAERLQAALTNRVLIDEAKEALAARDRASLQDAFDQLRRLAREGRRPLTEVARALLDDEPARALPPE